MIETISAEEYNALAAKKQRKYRNEPTEVDGIPFSSQAEARRYGELKLLLAAGEIRDLELQPRFPLVVNGRKVCVYVADFRYVDTRTGRPTVEDVKSTATKTATYRIKHKLMWAVYDIEVKETR